MSDDITGGGQSDQPTQADEIEVTEKPGGLGSDGTIPDNPDGVAAGVGDEASTFEPEEEAGSA